MSDVVDARTLAEVFVTLFVIMDPPGTVPIFLGLTGAMTGRQRNRAARQAILVAFGVIVSFALFGQQLLSYMHISLPALQASGGLLLLLVAIIGVHVCLWLSMRFANVIHRVLKDSGTILISRIAGLLLAAIAVQLVADAVRAFIQAG